MLKLIKGLAIISLASAQQILDTHDDSQCIDDDGSTLSRSCCSEYSSCNDMWYDKERIGLCADGYKTEYTCICKSGDIFCDTSDSYSYNSDWDAEWNDAAEDVASAVATTILLLIFIPIIICICVCVCCCACNKTCCFEQKQDAVMVLAPPPKQNAPQ